MTQTWAIFVDAYRALNAKKMFWFVLIITVLVAGAFALVGIDEQGLCVGPWHGILPMINSTVLSPAVFYKGLFLTFGVGFWLSWIATILALVSTASIFPDLITVGSIDLLVSKPIGRLRLFLTEYVAGLLFAMLQVAVFCFISFLIIGIRGGVWEPGLFIAVPLMVVFFSYLFAMSVFIGILTRSTLAALLLTITFWSAICLLELADGFLVRVTTAQEEALASESWRDGQFRGPPWRRRNSSRPRKPEPEKPKLAIDEETDGGEKKNSLADALKKSLLKGAVSAIEPEEPEVPEPTPEELERKAQQEKNLADWKLAYHIVYGVKTVLPKTWETLDLLERWLVDLAELPEPPDNHGQERHEVETKAQEKFRGRSVAWVIGTSLLFEFLVLACAAYIFCRRDY